MDKWIRTKRKWTQCLLIINLYFFFFFWFNSMCNRSSDLTITKIVENTASYASTVLRTRKIFNAISHNKYSRQQNYSNTFDNTWNFSPIWSSIFITTMLFMNSIMAKRSWLNKYLFHKATLDMSFFGANYLKCSNNFAVNYIPC